MDPLDSKLFATAFIFAFAAQVLTPLAYAGDYYYGDQQARTSDLTTRTRTLSFADPAVVAPATRTIVTTPSFSCNVKSMDVNEVNRYLLGLAAFQAEQISSAPTATLAKTDPTNATEQNKALNVNVNVNAQPIFPILTVFDAFQIDNASRDEIAKEFDEDPEYGTLTLDQVKVLSSRKPGSGDKISQLLGLGSGAKKVQEPYEKFKVKLPNGVDAPLEQILNLQPQGKANNCLLDSTHIQGKATFMALLDKDLFVGFDKSPTAVKSPQHITSTQTTVALNSYAGTIILPSFYEKAINYVGFWNRIELWSSIFGAMSIALAKTGPLGLKKEYDELNRRAEVLSKYSMGSSFSASSSLEDIRKNQLEVYESLVDTERNIRKVSFQAAVYANRPLFIWLLGLAWLGPARVGLSASNQILLSSISSAPKFNDNYLQVYVNQKEFASKFRSNTDVMGSGLITDFASDFVEGGAPRKAFQAGKLMFINRDSTPDEIASNSITSFARGGSGWNIRLAWKGPSDNTLFEDIRNQREYTSLALYSNNLALGTTLQNKAQYADYFRALAIAAPILNMIISKAAVEYLPLSIATLARMGIADLVITQFIDPVTFSPNELCQQSKLDNYLAWYTAFTTVSIGESVWSMYSPTRSLLPFLGNKLKGIATEPLGKAIEAAGTGNAAASKSKLYKLITGKDFKSKIATTLEKDNALLARNNALQAAQIAKQNEFNRFSDASGMSLSDFRKTPDGTKMQLELNDLDNQLTAVSKAASSTGDETKKALHDVGTEGEDGVLPGMTRLYQGLQLVDPVQLGKAVVGGLALQYASTCKDTSYKIMAYQKLTDKIGASAPSLSSKLDPLKSIKGLNLTNLLSGFGDSASVENMPEILNLRGFHQDEEGMLTPEDLYYIHLDGASQQWYGVFYDMEQRGCFRLCMDNKDSAVCADEAGIVLTDKKTGKSITLSNDTDRAKLVMASPQLAKTIVPNKIIEAPMQCGDTEIMAVTPGGAFGGNLMVTDNACGAASCLRTQVAQITGRAATDDLSASGFGAVTAVYTTKGIATASNGKIRFIYTGGEKKSLLGLKTENLSGTEIQ
ncbi:MAG: hypothetical protein V1708_04175, partial [Candidatus Micrarchaeota archaeon]